MGHANFGSSSMALGAGDGFVQLSLIQEGGAEIVENGRISRPQG